MENAPIHYNLTFVYFKLFHIKDIIEPCLWIIINLSIIDYKYWCSSYIDNVQETVVFLINRCGLAWTYENNRKTYTPLLYINTLLNSGSFYHLSYLISTKTIKNNINKNVRYKSSKSFLNFVFVTRFLLTVQVLLFFRSNGRLLIDVIQY